MNDLKSNIQNYIETELTEIGKPINPNKKQVYRFNNIDVSLNLLFQLLNKSNEIEETTLQRVADNFYNHIAKIIDFNIQELPNAIEGLATNFEPFLKLIAYLKFGDTDLWHPNDDCAGISKTTLNNLIIGKISNKYTASPELPLKDIPEPIIEYKGMKRTILDFVRAELRNGVHNAKPYSRMELMHYSNIVLSAYLFAIEDNLLFLKQCFLKEYQYLKTVIEDKNYINLDKVYIELLGHEEYTDIDVAGTELIDEFDLLSDIENIHEFENNDDLKNIENERRTDSIIKIASDTLHLEIIGQGGSGKSTTLYKILYNNAFEILKGNSNLKTPFFINANEYSPTNNFIKILSKKIDTNWIQKSLQEGKLQLLIDGLNEITENYKNEAYKEINKILFEYPDNSVILTERKLNFERRFDIPVFELKDLNEEKIYAFVKAYAGSYSEKIWSELQKNENMLHLAYNPLMLKMILSVSKQGNIPKNRGLLYQLFIKTIFQREKTKKHQIRTDTKIDILSHIAYIMRQEGTVTLSNSKFKKITIQKLSEINSSVSVNILYTELLDNLIIIENQNEDVSFFHETYLEYFCAIQLKSYFEISGDLPISLNDKRWFESLIMCGELLKGEKKSILFFEYIFRGQKNTNSAKYLKDFTTEDFNENINIACKIAYSLKSIKPDIYKLAEQYLSNYVVIWKYIYYVKKIEPIPITELFASVTSLNSKKIIKTLVFNFGWANIWLNSGKEEINSFYIENIIIKRKDFFQNDIVSSINNNTPDFSTFYNAINQSIEYYSFSKAIKKQLEKLNTKIIKNVPENQLKLYYKENKDFTIFKEILKNDIYYISNYNFQENEKSNNKQIFSILVKYHIQNEITHDIIKQNLLLIEEYNMINYIFKNLSYFKQHKCLSTLFEMLYDLDEKQFFDNIQFLQIIPFEKLTDKLKEKFQLKNAINKIPYESLKKKKHTRIYSCKTPKIDDVKLFTNSIYLLNNIYKVKINDLCNVTTKGNQQILLSNSEIIEKNIEMPEQGTIIIEKYSVNYIDCKLTKKGDKYIFTLPEVDYKSKNDIKLKSGDIVKVNNQEWRYRSWDCVEVNSDIYRIYFAILNNDELNIEIPKIGFLELDKENFNYNYRNIHPEIIIRDKKIMKSLKKHITEPKAIEFVRKLGLVHLFHKNIENVNYGIVLDIYNTRLKIYSIKRKMIDEYSICSKNVTDYKVDTIVVIEDNNTINVINENDANLNRVGYKKSEIVYLDEVRREGFIKMTTDMFSSDYFFHFKSCNFSPKISDFVKFIPALNPSKNHSNEPIALKISKIDYPKCRILFSVYDEQKERIWGKAINIITDEELFYRLNFGQEKYIKNFNDSINEKQIYEYSVIKEKTVELLKLIKLIKLL